MQLEQQIGATISQALRPDRALGVSEWADEYRFLSSKDSSEPGKFRTARTPYLREIMNDLSNTSPVERVVFIAGAQVGKTTVGMNWLGYVMHISPGPILCVQPTVDIAKRFSKQRVQTMIDETPVLSERVSNQKSRDADNTQLMKGFPGGTVMLAGANSAAGLRSMPIRYLFADEIDAYPVDLDGEGSPLALAEKRTTTFNRRKIFFSSTPTLKDASAIESEFLRGDQRYFYVPCPHCNHYQQLKWDSLKWRDSDPSTAHYLCSDCGTLIEERYKTKMLNAGKWKATAKGDGKTHSYHLNSLYSPIGWKSWSSIVDDFLKAKEDPAQLKTWVNTTLGETWEDQYSARLDPMNLMSRAEGYEPMTAPEGVLMVTAGVDVQDDRLEIGFEGWGHGEENWKLGYERIYGDPSEPALWDKLVSLIQSDIKHECGAVLKTSAVAIDSGGHFTQRVYDFARDLRYLNVFAVKGRGGAGVAVISKPTKVDFKKNGQTIRAGAELFMVGVDGIKQQMFNRLRKQEPGAGYTHFPKAFEQEYYNQLTSEKQITKHVNGMPKRIWVKKDSARNEALDVAVYNYAALNWVYLRRNKNLLFDELANQLKDARYRRKSDKKRQKAESDGKPLEAVSFQGTPKIVRKKSAFWS